MAENKPTMQFVLDEKRLKEGGFEQKAPLPPKGMSAAELLEKINKTLSIEEAQDLHNKNKDTLDIVENATVTNAIENKNPGEIKRKKAPADYKPKKEDVFKEEDIIQYMFKEWYIGGLNWAANKAIGAMELGAVRTWEWLDRSIEDRRNFVAANKGNSPRGRLAEKLNKHIISETEKIKESFAPSKEVMANTMETIINKGNLDEIKGLSPELRDKVAAECGGKSDEEVAKIVKNAYVIQQTNNIVKAMEKPVDQRTPEEAKAVEHIPEEFIKQFNAQRQIKEAEGAPFTDDQKNALAEKMLAASLNKKIMVLEGTAAKILDKQERGSKQFEDINFVDNDEAVKNLFDYEGAIIEEALYKTVKKDPTILLEKDGKISQFENMSRTASKAFDDEREKAAGGSAFMKNNFKKFCRSAGIDSYLIEAEVELEKKGSYQDKDGKHTRFTEKFKEPKLSNSERREGVRRTKSRILAQRSGETNFSAGKFLDDRGDGR